MAALLVPGCAQPGASGRRAAVPAPSPVLLDAPFFPDRTDQCGPSALASVLDFWKKDVTPRGLKAEIYRSELRGSLSIDLLLAAEAHGMTAELLEGGLPRLKKELDAAHPLIAFINQGFRFLPVDHYLVVTGYDDEGIYANSGMRKNAFIPYKKFVKQWERNDQWALLLLPAAR